MPSPSPCRAYDVSLKLKKISVNQGRIERIPHVHIQLTYRAHQSDRGRGLECAYSAHVPFDRKKKCRMLKMPKNFAKKYGKIRRSNDNNFEKKNVERKKCRK